MKPGCSISLNLLTFPVYATWSWRQRLQWDELCKRRCGSSRRAAGKTLLGASRKLPGLRKQCQATGWGVSWYFDIKQDQTYIASTVSVKTKSCCRQPSSSLLGDLWTSFANTLLDQTAGRSLHWSTTRNHRAVRGPDQMELQSYKQWFFLLSSSPYTLHQGFAKATRRLRGM